LTSPIAETTVRCPRCGHIFETLWRASLVREHFPEMSVEDFRRYVREVNTAACPECGTTLSIAPALAVDGDAWLFT
jgi:predicted RNA-binding Zn-ribbon protein involved in translation (DUF1610 family)